MTATRRTVEDPNGDIVVYVDTADLGAGSGDVPYVKLVSGVASSTNLIGGDAVNGLDVDVTRVTGNVTVIGGDVPDTPATTNGSALLVAGRAESTTPTAVSDGDTSLAWMTLEGAQVVSFNRTRTSALIPTVDTAVYADLDRLGSVVTVSNAALRNGGSGMIVAAMLQDDALSNFGIEAFFFQVTPTLANADNGIWDISDANMATAIPLGRIDFLSTSSTTHTAGRFTPGLYLGGPPAMHYTCASGDTALYMSLRARGAYDAVATDDLTIWLELLRY